MMCLTTEEMQGLIELLEQIPDVNQPSVRFALLVGIPQSLLNNTRGEDAKSHLTSIVNILGSEMHFKLEDESYPIITLIKNALSRAKDISLHSILQQFLEQLCTRYAITLPGALFMFPGSGPKNSSDVNPHFCEELDNFIIAVEKLEEELHSARVAFINRIHPTKCSEITLRLTTLQTSISSFSSYMDLSSKPPLVAIARGVWLTKEIAYCNGEFQTLLTNLQRFRQAYGIGLEQPQEKREELQQFLMKMQFRCESMLKEARKLRDKIDDQRAEFVEVDNIL